MEIFFFLIPVKYLIKYMSKVVIHFKSDHDESIIWFEKQIILGIRYLYQNGQCFFETFVQYSYKTIFS